MNKAKYNDNKYEVEEIVIMCKNTYGPNGVAISRFIESLEVKENVLRYEYLTKVSTDAVMEIRRHVHKEIESQGRVKEMNHAVEDATQQLELTFDDTEKEQYQYFELQDVIVYIVEMLIIAELNN